MLIAQALSFGKEILGNNNEAQILLALILDKSKEFIFAHPEVEIDDNTFNDYKQLISRRAKGVPLAYLLNHREFFGNDFYVDERVLIPRPETELLVEEALKRLKIEENSHTQTICDIGTGSGCIAISIAKASKNCRFIATDISGAALFVAKKNAQINDVAGEMEFIECDLISDVLHRDIDGIVANLPYIGAYEYNLVEKDVVAFEPHEALFGGKTGLELFEKLFIQIKSMAARPKWLIAEIGFKQRKNVSVMIKKFFGAKCGIEWKKDLAGLDRLFIINFHA